MPKAAPYLLAWSPAQQSYMLSERAHHELLDIVPESRAWFAWLDGAYSFTFQGKGGSYTMRKEANRPGEGYWYAYVRSGEKLLKKYVGRTTEVTFARLEEVAIALHAARSPAERMPTPSPFAQHESALPLVPEDSNIVDSPLVLTPQASANQHGDLLTPLLATKLHHPRPRVQLVSRSHLVERLQQGAAGALTLVSAPAGFGKTTLLAQWLASTRVPVAWLSLEPEDNEPTRFLTYLIAALQTLDPDLGTRARALLAPQQPAELQTVLTVLANDLMHWQGEDYVLVLDDYHVVEAPPIHQALTYLVEHLPPQLHLIIATRADPPLPLARLRVRGELTELRVAELRFGAVESGIFLEEVMGLQLSPEDVTTLQTRTEGWVAGLQLAALSLQGRPDASSLLPAFTGSHRFVLDYLSEEVLSQQPSSVQTFLLQTSVLSRLSGSLCDAVTGQEQSQAILEALERANLFVVALDDERQWYRYHHLFADLLRSRLQQTMPAMLPDLHRRASTWYEQHDLIGDALHHARLAPDLDRAMLLVEQHTHELVFEGQAHTVLSWLASLPDDLVRTHPHLCFSQALLLMFTGHLGKALLRLHDAEQSALHLTQADEAQAFLNQVATVQAYILFFQGDLARSVALAQQASDQLAERPMQVREATDVIAAHGRLLSGDVRRVEEQGVTRLPSPLSVGRDVFAMEVFVHLTGILLHARLLRLQGHLRQAATTYEQMGQVQGEREGAILHPGYCFGLGELRYAWNDLDAAERLLEQGREVLGGPLTLAADAIAQGYASLAYQYQARNKHTSALAVVEAFVQLADARQFAPAPLAFVGAVRAHLELMGGHLAVAVRWAEANGLSAEDDPSYPREREYLTFARVRIAQARVDPAGPFLSEALRLLELRLSDAEAKARLGSVLEILILQSLAFSSGGKGTEALAVFERALLLAEPQGYIRLFVDEGEPMVTLLRQAYAHEISPDYVVTLLSAAGVPVLAAPSPVGSLLEPLTPRELEVLRLLAAGLSNQAIAQELIVTVGTVKRHINSIYGKLAVQSRTQAVARAQTLHLL